VAIDAKNGSSRIVKDGLEFLRTKKQVLSERMTVISKAIRFCNNGVLKR
jgi:hypothetical protein